MIMEKADGRKVFPITPISGKNKRKTLILVRHAQSVENVKVIELCDGIARIKKGKFPTWRQISSTFSLLKLTRDSLVSDLGKRQINDMHIILKEENFWSRKIDLVICSPLTRAKDTCNGILPTDRGDLKVQILDDLEEATIYEHVFSRTLLERIERFKQWLVNTDEETIVIVGHSQYFKKMLGLKTLMRNCDVWQCDFNSGYDGLTAISSTSARKYEYKDMNLLARTLLADVHPYDKLTNTKENKTDDETDENENEGNNEKIGNNEKRKGNDGKLGKVIGKVGKVGKEGNGKDSPTDDKLNLLAPEAQSSKGEDELDTPVSTVGTIKPGTNTSSVVKGKLL